MSIKGDPNASRGPGAERFNRLLHQRASERLEDGKHMVYDHALRCLCKLCGRLLDWDSPEDISYTETECCGLLYRLQPRTVIVRIEDVSSRPILPKMAGSSFSDPNFVFSRHLIDEPKAIVIPAKKTRRCGICRSPGHTRRNCPKT